MQRIVWMLSMLAMGLAIVLPMAAAWGAAKTPADYRAAMGKGNYKDAYDGLAPLVTSPAGTDQLAADFQMCLLALNNLGRTDEIDAFREKAIVAHGGDWRLLLSAAQSYRDQQHYGAIIAGEFKRGNNRNGDGKWVNALSRDRVRALQLMEQGAALLQKKDPAPVAEVAQFYYEFASILLYGDNGEDAWQLQVLTDLTKLPDYEETGRPWYWGRRYEAPRGAPVDENGKPVFYSLPKGGWAGAKNDGERWRWALLQASELSVDESFRARLQLAGFLEGQFGVESMAGYAQIFADKGDGKKDESGPYAVSSLKDGETIAKLANGIKRFELPDEFNPIRIYESVANDERAKEWGASAMGALGQIYLNRQQYSTGAEWYKKAIAKFGEREPWRQQLDQIEKNWGMFESVLVQPAGEAGAKVDLRFRNGKKIAFTARELDVAKLLSDVKAYIRTKPNQLEWERVDVQNIGYRMVTRDEGKYYKGEPVKWELALEPRANHFDKRITVETPLKKAGAYLLTGEMEGGNTTRIVVWVADTVIVNKPLNGETMTYVADAVTGRAIADAQVEYFAYRQQYVRENRYRTDIQSCTLKSDADGMTFVKVSNDYNDRALPAVDEKNPVFAPGLQWLTTATTADGRLAFMGFHNVWRSERSDAYDSQYNQTKAFFMTDRPVYRPEQKMQFKMWLGNNQYDQEGKNPHARERVSLEIRNPKGEIIKTVSGKLDEWGGIAGEMMLEKGAALGVYTINLPNVGGMSFRVEEYKKPEFEVTVEAPGEPVMLGEKIPATIKAKYYFGSPVTTATVKYKVTRVSHEARWYPYARWDWFYEPGYWWFGHDYLWYPGFGRWGCFAPVRHWWPGGWSNEQPEVVQETEVPIGPDGTVKVEIDSAVAKAAYGDKDHKYTITAEVTDESRRTITGTGEVLVAREPFKVYTWTEKGYYHTGETIHADYSARTLDGKEVKGKVVSKLYKITYGKDGEPVETEVPGSTQTSGPEHVPDTYIAGEAGQFRLSVVVDDGKHAPIEGGYVFVIRGGGFTGKDFHFNDVEITTDKKEYKAGEKVRLMINVDREDATVLLFVRASNGVYPKPRVLKMQGKSTVEEVEVGKKDMPNFFVEAMTVANAKVATDVREVIVPPEDRILNVTVTPDATEYKPGQKGTLTVKVTEKNGEPFTGAAVLSLYDKAVEYISGGSNVADIRKFFWQWRRTHTVSAQDSLEKYSGQVLKPGETGMAFLGVFGAQAAEFEDRGVVTGYGRARAMAGGGVGGGGAVMKSARMMDSLSAPVASAAPAAPMEVAAQASTSGLFGPAAGENAAAGVEPTIRSNFADTALWAPQLVTAVNGTATVDVTMPENLSTWRAKVWSYGNGSRVGQAETDVVTRKNLIVRLQAPRFFVEKDLVVISANVHNYLKSDKLVKVSLEVDGDSVGIIRGTDAWPSAMPITNVTVPKDGERRVDWLVKVNKEGKATLRVKAITDEESDATQMSFPVYVHGMLKTESFSGALRPKAEDATAAVSGTIKLNVPKERKAEQTRLEIRYSPSVASAMVDALPYLAEYPYGCTEQTLNRFVPTVITQKVLLDMKLDLEAIKNKRTNLNAQQLGDPAKRAEDWNLFERNPVFDAGEVKAMVADGVTRLTNMQLSDGGWGWFSGYGEQSWPHTTAVVVHGLQMARDNGAAVDAGVIDRGVQWLVNEQAKQVAWIKEKRKERKASDIDAFVYMVLVDAGRDDRAMRELLFEDRQSLAFYSKAMFGLALQKVNDPEKLGTILENCRQFVVQDDDNQTAYLKLPNSAWWCWYGSEYEATAYYLKLLARTDPKGETTSRIAKYLINNREHGTYWKSTRDTAYCIEALADYIRASGETRPDMTVRVALDGKEVKQVKVTAENLFTFDNALVVEGAALADGPHTIEVTREGTGPLYYNAYLTNFTLEDFITKAGLEVKVDRKIYKLTRDDRVTKAEGAHGQAVDKREERYVRTELTEGQALASGDLVEVEMKIESKNDYEYIVIEDMKAAGFEPVEVRSGYNGNDLGAYVEFRDERVAFFARVLGRGTHSVAYRLRAEIPGAFSALPTRVSAMYAPELRANSDEAKLQIVDKPR